MSIVSNTLNGKTKKFQSKRCLRVLIGISFTSNKTFLSLHKRTKDTMNDDCLLEQWYGRRKCFTCGDIYLFHVINLQK